MGLILVHILCVFFFFKQKTAYEMRISDWSSDVCSSDLILPANVPNNVVLGAAEVFYGVQLQYFDWLLIHFPVLGLLKSALLVLVVWLLFREAPTTVDARTVPEDAGSVYWSRDERIMAVLLAAALALWASAAAQDRATGRDRGWQ